MTGKGTRFSPERPCYSTLTERIMVDAIRIKAQIYRTGAPAEDLLGFGEPQQREGTFEVPMSCVIPARNPSGNQLYYSTSTKCCGKPVVPGTQPVVWHRWLYTPRPWWCVQSSFRSWAVRLASRARPRSSSPVRCRPRQAQPSGKLRYGSVSTERGQTSCVVDFLRPLALTICPLLDKSASPMPMP